MHNISNAIFYNLLSEYFENIITIFPCRGGTIYAYLTIGIPETRRGSEKAKWANYSHLPLDHERVIKSAPPEFHKELCLKTVFFKKKTPCSLFCHLVCCTFMGKKSSHNIRDEVCVFEEVAPFSELEKC